MNRLLRNSILVLAFVCFIFLATGITLQLHFYSHEHPQEHDFDKCSTCQQLLILNKFTVKAGLNLVDTDQFEYLTCDSPDTVFVVSQPKPFDSRPPPSFL